MKARPLLHQPITAIVRGGDWWEHKLVPILCGFYATLLLLRAPIAAEWPGLLVLALSLLPGAAYVSIVNDLCDIDSDAAAGKPNRMAGRTRAFRRVALLSTLAIGGGFCFVWRDQPRLLFAYLAAWVAFTVYSVPPFRLKARGLAGVVADAAGAHAFPTLLAATAAGVAAGRYPGTAWLVAIGAWSGAYGLRGNLWHQLLDRDGDRAARVRTFAATHRRIVSVRVGALLAFPVEFGALAYILHALASPWPALALLAYALLVARRIKMWRIRVVIVEPGGAYLILLHEFYDVFLPIALIGASALTHPGDLAVLAVHLLLFGKRPRTTLLDSWTLIGRPIASRLTP